jgi:hypothetical protein
LSTRAHIALTHEDSAVSHLELDVALLLDPNVLGLPSVLGRDVLYRGHLHFDPSAGGVYFDAPKGSFVI